MWEEAVPGTRYDLISEIWRESDRRDADIMLGLTKLIDLPRLDRWNGYAVAHVLLRADPELRISEWVFT
jgi:hypothetical protein